jgi:hypothetical protein
MRTIEPAHNESQQIKSVDWTSGRCPFLQRNFRLTAILLWLISSFLGFTSLAETLSNTVREAYIEYSAAKSNYVATASDRAAALRFARACFNSAEISTNDSQRASFALEGIRAANFVSEAAPKDAAGHFFLAVNLGQLAQTKSLGALSLVKQMEQAFLKSIRADPAYDNAAAHRSLGMLYLEAPGWPVSIGSKTKAREHLENAVQIAPKHPDNLLTLIEALIRWKNYEVLPSRMDQYRKLLPSARKELVGRAWEQAWQDWEERWQKIIETAKYSVKADRDVQ